MKRTSTFKALKKIILPLITVALALTPFYGIAYIIAIFCAVRIVKFSKTFSTIFGRTVLSFLLLAATIMFAGLVAWLTHIQTYPILVLVIFSLILTMLSRLQKIDVSSPKFVDHGDIISILLSLIAPVIIMSSFFLPKPTAISAYQFLSIGWDNANHLSMLETTSLENGYVYGNYEDVQDKVAIRMNAYPQAWHLATSNLTNGFGTNLFNPSNPILVMGVYIIVLFAWYTLTVYLFTKLAWRLFKSTPKLSFRGRNWLSVLLFIAANILIQLIVFWGAIGWGFVNYLGCIAYLLLMTAMIIDRDKDNHRIHFISAIISGAAAALCWFLPIPSIALAILLGFMGSKFPFIKRPDKSTIGLWLITLVACLAVSIQVLIFTLYTHVEGQYQINAGSIGGTFSISQLLVAIVCVFTFYCTIWLKSGTMDTHIKYVTIVAPMLILGFALYAYHIFNMGGVSYYFGKILGITLVMAGIFFIPLFVRAIEKLNKGRVKMPNIFVAMIGICTIFIFIIGTNQSTDAASRLTSQHSKVPLETAEKIIDYLKNEDPKKTDLLIFRGISRGEDINGSLYMTVSHLKPSCIYTVADSKTLADIKKLSACVETLDKDLIIITSNKTKEAVASLDQDNIRVINIP